MGRTFTMRGKFSVADNALTNNGYGINIFDYVSPDRKKAWKVSRAWLWPITVRGEIGGSNGQYIANAALGTEDIQLVDFSTIPDVTENRFIAWSNQTYQIQNAGSDFLQSRNGTPDSYEFIVDPDRMVVQQLFLWFSTTSSSATRAVRGWAFIVEVGQMKGTAWESVFQQIKGMGQDLFD